MIDIEKMEAAALAWKKGEACYYVTPQEILEFIEKLKALKADRDELKRQLAELTEWNNQIGCTNYELRKQLPEYKADAERDATLFRNIRKLCGYVENGSDTTFSLFQDDATKDWTVKVGSKSYYSTSAAKAIDEAIKGATE